MKKVLFLATVFSGLAFLGSCGGSSSDTNSSGEQPQSMVENGGGTPENNSTTPKTPDGYDPKRGEGKYNEENVKLAGLDAAVATKGEAISNTKCFSCHKTTNEKLVGPGWAGVTQRRTPWWILNFITNPDPMIDKDPEVQAQLELCLVRMPNQNLSDEEARQVFEFMRKNDGAK